MPNINHEFPLKSIYIQNFKCIKGGKINLKPITILLGKNGSGKTSVLEAFDLLYEGPEYSIPRHLYSFGKNIQNYIIILLELNGYRLMENPANFNTYSFYSIASLNPRIAFISTNVDFSLYLETNEIILIGLPQSDLDTIEHQIKDLSQENKVLGIIEPLHIGFHVSSESLAVIDHEMISKEVDSIDTLRSIFQTDITSIVRSRFGKLNSSSTSFAINQWKSGNSRTDYQSKPQNVVFSLKPFDILPNLYKTNTLRIIKNQYNKIEAHIPSTPRDLSHEEQVFSLFHYGVREELEDIIDRIKYWAKTLGFSSLTQTPEANAQTSLRFYDQAGKEFIDISFGGSGISSVLFLIAECCIAKDGDVLLIDEPELHLHASSQATLVDIFIETMNRGVQLIISTHSEYLLLRLQRRIAEGPQRIISSDQVSIVELTHTNNGTQFSEIPLSEDGSYADILPETIKFASEEFRQLYTKEKE